MSRNMDEHSAGFGQIERKPGATAAATPMPTVEELACMLAARIDSATPSELRQAAIMLDDKGNDFRTHRSLRPVYMRLADVIKLVK